MIHSKRFASAIVLFLTVSTISMFIVIWSTGIGNKAAIAKDNVDQVGLSESQVDVRKETQVAAAAKTGTKTGKIEIVKYIVKSGDTLDSISKSYGININTISESNRISEDATLKIGQELRFPSVVGVLYKVSSGDTFWDISKLYGVDMDEIASANNLNLSSTLKLNQEIILPGVESLKAVQSTSASSAARKTATVKVASRGISYTGSMWPLVGSITSKFGPRWGKNHNGLDIAAPTGTLVRAFMSGTVVYSGWEVGYGNLVKINHGNGLVSYYGHNSKLLVSAGEHIDKGQTISKVGSTGDSTGPHLHFEIRKYGVPVNPLNYLK